jgi:hypothetical protein
MFALFTKAQTNSDCKKNEDFQIKLNKFRYTLYADLMPQKEKILNDKDFFSDTSSVIYKKLEKFYHDNSTDIKDFQKYELNKYSTMDIDFKKFKIDPSFNSTLSKFNSKSDILAGYYIFSVMSSYNPISYAFSLDNMLLTETKALSDIGISVLINNLASPLVETKMLPNDRWEIIIDNYEYIFIHEFNLLDNKIKVTKVFKRL